MTHDRLTVLRQGMAAQKWTALLVVGFANVRYVSGFSGSNGAALIDHAGLYVATDGRYVEQARSESPAALILEARDCPAALLQNAHERGITRIAADLRNFNYVAAQTLLETARELHVEIVDAGEFFEIHRQIKSESEIEALTSACEITVRAWEQLLHEGVLGKSEIDLAGRLEHLFRIHGAENRAFDSIVATGPNSAIPHHQPTHRLVATGDFLKIDCGARFAGYHADFTRTVVVGSAAEWQREIYAIVQEAQQAALDLVTAGADSQDVGERGVAVVHERGFGEFLPHQIGHGVGLEIHERPFLGRHHGKLSAGMPITVEPGIYLPGRGGVRIEDTVLVSDPGYVLLTNAPRDLLEL